MGAGIAQLAATAGADVVLVDVEPELAEAGRERIASALRKLAAKGKIAPGEAEAAIVRIRPTAQLGDVSGCGLVVEAVPERIDLKRSIFAELGRVCGPETILATNTSSLPVGEIAAAAASPERVAGMHFFNPAPVLPLVEVVRATTSSEAAVERLVATARAWGKTPVRVRDTPGFVVNRVARPFYLEAFRMVEEGIATIEVIDAALEGAGFPMGPGRLVDLIGVDVNWSVTCSIHERFGRPPRFEPHPLQRRMIEEGTLGRKTGRGFYRYEEGSASCAAAPVEVAPELAEAIALRTIGCIVNEAAFALEEGVATAAEIDLAMKLGMNYPKGPLEWARDLGLERIVSVLRQLGAKRPERYPIARRLLEGNLR
jgi:3-hydroxybutyryl-CoA dehydrogenase